MFVSGRLVWMLGRSRLKAGRSDAEGSNQQPRQSSISPHHVKVSLAISTTTSLKKWVALKRALAHSAHVVLGEEEGQQGGGSKDMYREKKRGREWVEGTETKRRRDNGGTMETAWRWGAQNITVGRKLVKA